MKIKRIVRTLIIILIVGSNIGCDQISKKVVRERMDYDEQISLMSSYLTLTKVENTGAFLSVGQSLPRLVKIIVLNILPLIVMGLIFMYVITKRGLSNASIIGICFVVGGGIGNIYDRLLYGSVTDFLHIDFVLFQTGIFNMADVSIMVGIFIVLVDSYYIKWTRLNVKTVGQKGDV